VKNGSATVTIDEAGRITLPEEIREKAHLEPGMEVRVTVDRDGRVGIEPEFIEYKIVMEGPIAVAVPLTPVPPLTNEMVERAIDEIRASRGLIDDEDDRRR
jgi:AbrB family looped-hinge helix DNA binding protein